MKQRIIDHVAALNNDFEEIERKAEESKLKKDRITGRNNKKKKQGKYNKDNQGKNKNPHSGHRKRMDKKVEMGLENLPQHEQLEWILYLTIRLKDTNKIAHDLLDRFGTLQGVFNATEEELMEFEGINHRTAELLKNMNSLAGIVMRSWQSNVLLDEENVFKYVKSYFIGKSIECVYMFVLDSAQRVKSVIKLGEGTSTEVPLFFQSVSRIAAIQKANMVIIAHNHPSGICEPSKSDEHITREIQIALGSVGIKLFDSIIVTENECYSMKKEGKLLRVMIAE